MKKILFALSLAGLVSTATFTGCTSLDLYPVSTVTGAQYWKDADHFSAFMVGLHTQFREGSYNFFLLGEARSDVYGALPFGGEATQGMERLPSNTLNADNVGISNYAKIYNIINQANLMIHKAEETTVLSATEKGYYLGQAYGIRAFCYFHLLRSWGDVIIQTDYTDSPNISDLAKAVSPASQVLEFIKGDIKSSLDNYGTDYSFKQQKAYWSKAASLMLKADVYLWSAKKGGSNSDYEAAKSAILDMQQHATLGLESSYKSVFDYDNKGNKEIIFAFRGKVDEFSLWNGSYEYALIPQSTYLKSYFTEEGLSFDNNPNEKIFGQMRLEFQKKHYYTTFNDKDARKRATIKPVFKTKVASEETYGGSFSYKYQGTVLAGSPNRKMYDDYPIYRYAEALLFLAEAKAGLGESPATEINEVRERAFGKEYFDANKATLAYPNAAGDADVNEAILKERLCEFMVEGKRWYDLRRFGDEYVFKYTTADKTKPLRLLWPVDKTTLTNNRGLLQTPGYEDAN